MDKFWMVLVDGREYTRVKHDCPKVAREEAERLCQKEGKGVTILEAVHHCRPAHAPIEWDGFGDEPDVSSRMDSIRHRKGEAKDVKTDAAAGQDND